MLTPREIEGFRFAQRLAYSSTTHVAASLVAGMTERDAASLLHAELVKAGVRHWFHVPFAWFGDRTVLSDDWPDAEFLPSDRVLENGMPVILDVAPIVDTFVADIAYSFSFGKNAAMSRMLDDLAAYREAIPAAIAAGRSQREIYELVDTLIARQGYENRHRAYPLGVVGHRVTRILPVEGDMRPRGAFGPSALAFFHETVRARSGSAFWNAWPDQPRRPAPSIWAVEPHVGKNGVGAKFEELLVVTEDEAYWLDDDLPHVRRWSQRPTLRPSANATVAR